MKALMVNSTSGKVVNQKMRDQMYMRHLREVEKISNRQADNVTRAIQNYKSVSQLHQKHQSYAFQWHHKQEKSYIDQLNSRIKRKISEIKPYVYATQRKKSNRPQSISPQKLATLQNQDKNPENANDFKNDEYKGMDSEKSQQKRQISLHYRYRKKRQEQIDCENSKLIKAILSQRSSYLPKIFRNKQKDRSNSNSLQKQSQQIPMETERR